MAAASRAAFALQTSAQRRRLDAALAWDIVAARGSGFVATKIGVAHAPPALFPSLRLAFGLARLVPVALVVWRRCPGREERG